ncbi:MAG: restriction endonuclease subunit S [Comamonadaceae bacterium]|nr:MAG: restriction endonuclease subunit S [Comamonadaceae bacterium]
MNADIATFVSDNIDLWSSAVQRKSGTGRGGGKKVSHYGIERLRALILDLAVQGMLVSQDPGDEPATKLLTKIRSDRVDLTKSKVIGKGKAFPLVSAAPPFAIPNSWAWVQLSEIGHDWGQAEPESDFTYIDVGSIDQKFGVVRSPTVLQTDAAPSRARKRVKRGTIIYSTVRPYLLNIATIDQDFEPQPVASTAFAIVHPFDGVEAGYVFRYLRSPAFVRYVEGCQTGIAYPAINDRQFFAAWFPLPPHAEQQRIVAKVDELMALCDALEAKSASALETHQMLVETLLATLVNAGDPADLARQWARLEPQFDILFTTESSIEALKQTVLELAVRGKLAIQEATDEPAGELVRKWRIAKHRSLENGGDRRVKPAPSPTSPPFPIPEHWAIESFENVFLFIDYRGNTPPKTTSGIPLITAKNVRMGYLDQEPREYISDSTFDTWMTRGFPEIGDLFFTTEAPLGNICVNDIEEPFAIAQRLICFKPYGPTNTRFYMMAVMSRSMQRVLDDSATGMTARGIKAAKLKPIALPVPPDAEQQRIVAKVDQLMALCDALKARLTDAAETRKHLADAVVERAAA